MLCWICPPYQSSHWLRVCAITIIYAPSNSIHECLPGLFLSALLPVRPDINHKKSFFSELMQLLVNKRYLTDGLSIAPGSNAGQSRQQFDGRIGGWVDGQTVDMDDGSHSWYGGLRRLMSDTIELGVSWKCIAGRRWESHLTLFPWI
jgi:hypothetical protein